MVTVYKKRSAFMAIAFSIVILTGLLSLFVLMSLNNTLFSLQGSFSFLQSGYGQEDDVEETDESDDERDENEEENNNGQDEDENNRQTNSIDICCSWDEKLADGELTFKIIRGGESDVDEEDDEEDEDREEGNGNTNDATLELEKAVRDAVQEWNTKFLNLKLVEISSSPENDDADIEVQFIEALEEW